MRKILICISIAVVSMIISVISFMINDYHNYNTWMRQAGPRMMSPFPGWSRDDKRPKAPPRDPAGDFRNDRDHHREPTRDKDRRIPNRPGPADENPGNAPGTSDSTPPAENTANGTN